MFRFPRIAGAIVTLAIVTGSAAPAFAASSHSSSDPLHDARLDPAVVSTLDRNGAVDVLVTMRADGGHAQGSAAHAQVKARLHARKESVLSGTDATIVREYNELPVSLVHVQSRHQLERLLGKSDVTGLFLPRTASVDGAGQSDPTALNLIHQPQAVAAGYKGNGTYVAVLDTGTDYRQPAFGSCTAPSTPSTCRVAFAKDYAPNDGSLDDNGHGTNVAGIVANVAPGTHILAMDVFNGPSAYDSDILSALNDVANMKRSGKNIVATNMSLGYWYTYVTGTCTTTYSSVFGDLVSMGVEPVVAAGNTAYDNGAFRNGIGTPACDPYALPVGAVYDASYTGGVTYLSGAPGQCTDNTMTVDHPTCFSQTGPNLGLWAPGSFIDAAGIQESGTSQATPHVAGAVAVLAGSRPNATATEIRNALMASGPSISDNRAPSNPIRHRLDVMAALNTLFGMNLAPSVSAPQEHPRTKAEIAPTAVTYDITWKASDSNGIAKSIAFLQTNGGVWNAVTLSSPTATSFSFPAVLGSHYRVMVEAQDTTGLWSNVVYGRTFTPSVHQQNTTGITYSSGWATKSWTSASGGTLAVTGTANAYVKITTKASDIAWVATRASNRGVAKLYVDGKYVGSVDTGSTITYAHQVVFQARFSSNATHTVQIVFAGTTGKAIDADAFVVTN